MHPHTAWPIHWQCGGGGGGGVVVVGEGLLLELPSLSLLICIQASLFFHRTQNPTGVV